MIVHLYVEVKGLDDADGICTIIDRYRSVYNAGLTPYANLDEVRIKDIRGELHEQPAAET